MAIHQEAIRVRLDKLHEMIAMLETIRARGEEAYNNDDLLQAPAERALQIASQCVLDIGNHIINDFRDFAAEIIKFLDTLSNNQQ